MNGLQVMLGSSTNVFAASSGSLQCCICVLLDWTQWVTAKWVNPQFGAGADGSWSAWDHTDNPELGWVYGTLWQGDREYLWDILHIRILGTEFCESFYFNYHHHQP